MRESYFFVKNKGKKGFQKSAIPMQIYITMYRRSHCFASSTKKKNIKREEYKSNVILSFFYTFFFEKNNI